MSIRSLESLVRDYPTKTGAEILAMQEEDKREAEAEFKLQHKWWIDLIEDINTNGGYFRGKFGTDQHYFYNISDMRIHESGKVTATVESIVIFNGPDRVDKFSAERRVKSFEDMDHYALEYEMKNRVTKDDWDALISYLEASTKFWN